MKKFWKNIEVRLVEFYSQEDLEWRAFKYVGKCLLVLVPTLFLGPTLIVTLGVLPFWFSFFALYSYDRYRPKPIEAVSWSLFALMFITLFLNVMGLYLYLEPAVELLSSFHIFNNYYLY